MSVNAYLNVDFFDSNNDTVSMKIDNVKYLGQDSVTSSQIQNAFAPLFSTGGTAAVNIIKTTRGTYLTAFKSANIEVVQKQIISINP